MLNFIVCLILEIHSTFLNKGGMKSLVEASINDIDRHGRTFASLKYIRVVIYDFIIDAIGGLKVVWKFMNLLLFLHF